MYVNKAYSYAFSCLSTTCTTINHKQPDAAVTKNYNKTPLFNKANNLSSTQPHAHASCKMTSNICSVGFSRFRFVHSSKHCSLEHKPKTFWLTTDCRGHKPIPPIIDILLCTLRAPTFRLRQRDRDTDWRRASGHGPPTVVMCITLVPFHLLSHLQIVLFIETMPPNLKSLASAFENILKKCTI